MAFPAPAGLAANGSRTSECRAWLARLPELVAELGGRWELTLGEPFDGPEVSAAWVAPAIRAGGGDAVLKLGMPHMEGRDEIAGLHFWDGEPTVRVLEADAGANAMLLERCLPGTPLRSLPEPEQDVVLARLLRRLWRPVSKAHGFRPLAEMTAGWAAETPARVASWSDPGLVEEGLRVVGELERTAPVEVLLATDLHAGNVLRATREPWLVIDPKPFVGDPAYDATQHLFNCTRLESGPLELIRRFADLLELDGERVRLWTFARAAAEWRDGDDSWLARRLAP